MSASITTTRTRSALQFLLAVIAVIVAVAAMHGTASLPASPTVAPSSSTTSTVPAFLMSATPANPCHGQCPARCTDDASCEAVAPADASSFLLPPTAPWVSGRPASTTSDLLPHGRVAAAPSLLQLSISRT